MATPISASTPKVAPETTPQDLGTSDAKKTTKTKGGHGVDAMEALKASGLVVHGAKAGKISGAEVQGTVLSEFPIADLGQIKTQGRWAQGFRLDGGSLRLMWMNVRRTTEKDGTQGFEVFFQAQGPSIETYRQRLTQAGAKTGSFKFFNSDVDSSVADKSTLKKTGTDWGPSSQQALSLEQAGKWSVDFVTSSPEALKGAFRIRLLGTDADATAALQDVIKKLGLQALFSPPAPNALERFKLLRFMWQVAPGAADHLRFKPLSMLADALKDPLEKAELAPASLQAIEAEKLDGADMKARAQLIALLYQKSPAAFLNWVAQTYDDHGILLKAGGTNPNANLQNALTAVGLPADGPDVKAALEKTPSLEDSQALMRLALLAKKDRGAADAAVARDIESVKLGELEAALQKAGIDPSGERVKNLRFQEVYPGYFTVTDPSLSVELAKAGARYLYSTSDNAERVWQMLSGGQKSSMTRFQEGVLIQGKSSDADFGTGGAFSVFSRLVTDSIIKKARREAVAPSGGYSYSPTGFYDWGGSRPFKLIINRRALDRTDWYGYNGDNFGRSTGLTAENHGERIVNTINGNFSMSNEVMFPVGNDPSYVDFVVAPTEEKRKELIDLLTSKGLTELNGKTVEELVIVRTKLFEHPDDMSLGSAVEDAIYLAGFKAEIDAALTDAQKVAEAALPAKLDAEAATVMAKEGATQLKSNAQYYATQIVDQAANEALNKKPDLIAELGGDALKTAGLEAAKAELLPKAKEQLQDVNNYYSYYIDSAVQSAAQPKVQQADIDKLVESTMNAFVAEQPTPKEDTPAARETLRTALTEKLNAALKAHLTEVVKVEGAEAGKAKVAAMIDSEVPNNLRYGLQSTAKTTAAKAALAASPSGVVATILAEVEASALSEGKVKLIENFKTNAPSWLGWSIKTKIEEVAKKLASEAIVNDASPKALESTKSGAAEIAAKVEADFAEKHPEKLSPEEKAKVAAAIEGAIRELLAAAATNTANTVGAAESQAAFDKALAALAAGPTYEALATELMGTQAKTSTQRMVEQRVENAMTAEIDAAITAALAEASAAVKETLLPKILEPSFERAAQNMLYNYSWNLINPKANAGVDLVMKKLVEPSA